MKESAENEIGPAWYHYGFLFSVIILWSVFSVAVVQGFFGLLLYDSINWVALASILHFTYLLPLGIIIWRMKMSVDLMDPDWTFERRFVSFSEFREISAEYKSKYSLFTSRLDLRWILASLAMVVISIGSPFILYILDPAGLAFLPQIMGAIQIILGISYSLVLIAGVPSPLHEEFPLYSPGRFGSVIAALSSLPVLSWIGIILDLGEWRGYYSLREPKIAAKIDGMESVATLICDVDRRGIITSCTVENNSAHDDFPNDLVHSNPGIRDIIALLKKCVYWYMQCSEDKEILAEILDELETDFSNHHV